MHFLFVQLLVHFSAVFHFQSGKNIGKNRQTHVKRISFLAIYVQFDMLTFHDNMSIGLSGACRKVQWT